MVVIASFIVFWMTLVGIQTVLLRRWLQESRLVWVLTNLVGVLLGLVISGGVVYALVLWPGLDVLQSQTDGRLILLSGAIALALVLMAAQWLVLRQRFRLALLWAGVNILISSAILAAGFFLVPPLIRYSGFSFPIAILEGAIAGGLAGWLIDTAHHHLSR